MSAVTKLPDRLKYEIPKPPPAALLLPFALTVRETATYGRVDERRVRDAIATKKLKARTIGRRTLVLREDAESWLRTLPVRVDPYAEAIDAAMYASLGETVDVANTPEASTGEATNDAPVGADEPRAPILEAAT